MKHARRDYDRIQDPDGLIPEHEPVFLIRGQDICAPQALEAYAAIAESFGADAVLIRATIQQADAMREYQNRSGKHKVPDMPRDSRQ